MRDFLVEIGTEELPPRALAALAAALEHGVEAGLSEAELAHGEITRYATPRRLALLVRDLANRQPDKEVEKRGPPFKVAFDGDGAPTRAAEAFAKGCGVPVAELQSVETPKGKWLLHRAVRPGQSATRLLPAIVTAALDKLPVPKRMRWGEAEAEFVRPVHWVLLLYGEETIDATLFGMRAGNTTRGHRFHAPGELPIASPSEYETRLREAKVMPDFAQRRAHILATVEEAAAGIGGAAVVDEALLQEVTALVEWPVPIVGGFDDRFLGLPDEALIATLQGHQRYFPVRDAQGNLLARFITVSNIESRDPEQVRAGNERVVRPRLADATFFWETDRKQTLEERCPALAAVVFQARLGSLQDKSKRMAAIAGSVAGSIGGDQALAARAALLSKCDLLTEMVGEFPELQGTMGRYYALADGESEELALALEEQYKPRFAGDELPTTATGQALAIAEKLDTIVGSFAIGQRPTGAKDPFGLRRSALGVLRILIECELDLDLAELIAASAAHMPVEIDADRLADEIFDYMMDRLRAYYLDGQGEAGITPEMFEAVLQNRPTRPVDFHQRIRAVAAFMHHDAAASLTAANKRIANILRQAGLEETSAPTEDALVEPAEKQLFAEVTRLRAEVEPLLASRRYTDALQRLATLRDSVDAFFDTVMVMDEDPGLRGNRLALLAELRRLFLHTADLSRLQSG